MMWELIRANKLKSYALLGSMLLVMLAVGTAIAGYASPDHFYLGAAAALALWTVMFAAAYFKGDAILLGASGARPIDHDAAPRLYNVVEEMTIAAGLPQPPAVYVLEDAAPNAFATGRDPQHASIAVTRGLLTQLDREQLQGVIAHEMSHIRNYDIRFQTLVGILVGMIALVADFFLRWSFWGGMGRRRGGGGSGGDQGQAIFAIVALVLAILAPLAAYAVQFAVSRRREFLADASAVELTRNPLGLARALNTIATDRRPLKSANRATAHLYVENPLKKTKEATGVFDTHPPVQKRIAVLLEMAHVGPEALAERPAGPEGLPVDGAAPGPAGPSAPVTPTTPGAPPPQDSQRQPPPPSLPV